MLKVKTFTQTTLALLLGLILVKLFIVFTGRINYPIFVIWSLPLLAFAPFLIKKSIKAYQSFCFILLIYFLLASIRVFGIGGLLLDTFEIILIIILFIHSMYGPRTIRNNK
tara:strand:+ start:8095 stop:8427 length:333 start_codon:yes stop_codon:yes gene_type:complete